MHAHMQSNSKESTRPTIFEQHELKAAIEKFTKPQYIELFKIVKRHTLDFTQNTNGIFVNFKDLSTIALIEIQNFVKYIKTTNLELEKRLDS